MRFSPAQRRYSRRILILSVVYVALLLPIMYLFVRHLVAGPLAYVLAVLPALPLVGYFVAIGAYLVEEQDEYLRLLFARQSLIATGVAMTAATIWGFLEGFDLVPHAVAWAWPVVWFAGMGLAACVIGRLERTAA